MKFRLRYLLILLFINSLTADIQAQTNKEEYRKFITSHPFYTRKHMTPEQIKGLPKKDRPDLAWEQNYLMTLDPALGYPPVERLIPTLQQLEQYQGHSRKLPGGITSPWAERGPVNVGGRTRALMFDPNDVSGNKVWAGGVTGGLWHTNDITNSSSAWVSVDDFWDNIAITAITYDPNNSQIFYVGTGEGWGTGASRGAGLWKTTDGGLNWSQLSSTSGFYYVNDLIVRDEAGSSVIYAAVDGRYYSGSWHGIYETGLQRSTDGGSTWTQVLPNAGSQPYSPAQIALGADNRIWIGSKKNPWGSGGGSILYSDDGLSWTVSHTQASSQRVAIATAPSNANYIYALVETNNALGAVLKSTDHGANWSSENEPDATATGMTSDDFTRGQAWYDLIIAVDPNDESTIIAGGIDLFKSTNGGSSWTQLSYWHPYYGSPVVHADQHEILYRSGSSSDIIFGNDGGVYYSSDINSGSPSFTNRNNNYNVTQFYACAMHPTAATDYYLAGAQDNGSHKFSNAGLNSTVEVTGGDGAYCHIDQDDPNYQITSYVYNSFRRSTNGGSSFSSIQDDQTTGKFINPCDYDNAMNILYSSRTSNTIQRINDITASYSIDYFTVTGMVDIATHIRVSEYTSGSSTIFVGTGAGDIFKVTNANTATPTSVQISNGIPAGSISCIELGANENELLVTLSNFGLTSVWYSDNGGASWSSKEGNLPDMPIRWALFNPNNRDEVILATDLGAWGCDDFSSASPDWQASNSGFANVRVDMFQIRSSDNQVAAATYGRGLFTSDAFQQAANTYDAGVTQIVQPGSNICDTSIQPQVIVKNYGDSTMTTATILYELDGGAAQSYTWNGTLYTNQTDTISLNLINLSSGSHTIKIYSKDPNTQSDEDNSNDTTELSFTLNPGLSYPFTEDFQAATLPTNWSIANPGGSKTWEIVTGITGKNGLSTTAYFIDNYNYNNVSASDDIITHYCDLTGSLQPKLSFDVAYARYNSTNSETLNVSISTDCGNSFQQVYSKSGSDAMGNLLSTVAQQSAAFVPSSAGHWRSDTIDLAAYVNQKIIIKFSNINGYGNNLYLDNINVAEESICAVQNTMTTKTASCSASDGELTANPFSGTAPYTYSWSNTQTSANIQNLSSGWYKVTITDDLGCIHIDSAEITNAQFTISDSTITQPLCNGGNTGSIDLTLSGGSPSYSYSWSNSSTDSTITNLAPGTYSVTVTDNNACTASASFVIQSTSGIESNASVVHQSCPGKSGSDGSISLSPSNGTAPYTYLWDHNNDTTSAIAFLGGGNSFHVTIQDANGCQTLDTFDVLKPDDIQFNETIVSDTCNSGNGSITLIPSGGTGSFTFQWNNGSTSGSLINANAGLYEVTISDSNNCQESNSFIIDSIATTEFSINQTDNICHGGQQGTAKAIISSGSGPFQFLWSNSGTSDSISQLSAGTYTLSITDSLGCINVENVNILDGIEWVISFDSTDANCNMNDGAAMITQVTNSTAPLSYIWSDGQTTDTAFNLYAGSYGVSITDDNGCQDSLEVIVNNKMPYVSTNTKQDPTCYGGTDGSISLNISGGTSPYQILWSTGDSTQSISNIASGIYTVTVTDIGGCIRVYEDTLSEPSPLSGTKNTVDLICSYSTNGSAQLIPSGGSAPYSYSWSDGNTDSSRSGLSSGTYYFTVSDNNSCNWVDSLNINAPDSIEGVATINDANCNQSDGSISIIGSGGLAPYTYSWSNGSTDSNMTLLASGSYVLTITDANACIGVKTYIVNNQSGPSISISKTDLSCYNSMDGTATSNVSGGTTPYQYSWSSGSNSNNLTSISAGTYFLTVEDASGCITIDSVLLAEPDDINFEVITTIASCNTADGTATADSLTGGTYPYSYSWSNGSTGQAQLSLSAGSYDVTVTDANSCIASKAFNIINYLPNLNPSNIPISCYNADDGRITVNATGGVTPYSYNWSTGDTTETAQDLSPGYYSVTITDASGCITVYGDSMNEPDSIAIGITESNVLCNSGQDGSLVSNVTGGTKPYLYLWSNSGNIDSIANLIAGNYSLTVTDSNGCEAIANADITHPDPIQLIANVEDDHCQLGQGSIITSIFGGSTPYSYLWSNTQTTSSIQSLSAGLYYVTLTDANSCTRTDSMTIENGVLPVVTIAGTPSFCNQATGTAYASVNGGTSPYQYLWNTGDTSTNLTNIASGLYSLTITDSNSCNSTDSVIIQASLNYSKDFGNDTSVCAGDSITLSYSGIDSFSWSSNTYLNILTDSTVRILPDSSISYYIVLSKGSCQENDTLNVNVNALPSGNIVTANDSVAPGEEVTLSASGGTTYNWSPSSLVSDTSSASVNSYPTSQSTYYLSIIDSNGCSNTDSITIYMKDGDVVLYPMTGISPNGDGKNDFWVIRNIEFYPSASVKIYNRHGNQIFDTRNYQNTWQGNFDGKELNEGVYYYIIDFHSEKSIMTGNITLLR